MGLELGGFFYLVTQTQIQVLIRTRQIGAFPIKLYLVNFGGPD